MDRIKDPPVIDAAPRTAVAAPARHGQKSRRSRYGHEGRSVQLDLLRGVAILLVLGRHYVLEPVHLGPMQPVAEAWARIGWSGVDLFFVLSGYLVSGLLFAEYRRRNAVDVRRFVIRRGFKIWPSYFAYLGVVAAWLYWGKHDTAAALWSSIWPNLLHVQNYFHTPRIHTWSLAVEEHFYLAVALVFFLFLRGRRASSFLRMLPGTVIATIAILAFLRYETYEHAGPGLNLYATHLRFDGLLIGTFVSYLSHFEPAALRWTRRFPALTAFGGACLAAPVLVMAPEASKWMVSIGLTGMYIGFALILLGVLNADAGHSLLGRILAGRSAVLLAQIGFYSYSIYLWHVDLAQTPMKKLVSAALAAHVPAPAVWLVTAPLYVCAAVAAGYLMSRLLELPSLALRDRIFPRK